MWMAFQTWRARRQLRAHIRKVGWVGTYVSGEGADFAYTTGFQECLSSPDIIMFGASKEAANGLICMIHDEIKSGELLLTDDLRWPPEEMPNLAFRAVHPTQIRREHFNVAIWRKSELDQDRSTIEAFQLVWPDTNNVFPWEPSYDVNYRPQQAALYEPYFGPPDED